MNFYVIRLKPRGIKFSSIFDIVVSKKYKQVWGAPIAKLGYFDLRSSNRIIVYTLNLGLFYYWLKKGVLIDLKVLKLLKILNIK